MSESYVPSLPAVDRSSPKPPTGPKIAKKRERKPVASSSKPPAPVVPKSPKAPKKKS